MLDPRLVETFSRVLDVDPSAVNGDTSPASLPKWDSVAHINLIFELEDAFEIRFASDEIPSLNTVARLQAAIDGHRRASGEP
ncbi:MAG TPA: acyl carrier protein [Gemmatimonadaceae bacterium]|jgi:acyl carrier protein|nr:acyl carrier protein [Gemmatimonadaceae bacterium]